MEQLSTANTHFAVDLFRALNEDNPTGNIFISPFSISSALAMIFLGTRGNTAAQVSKSFFFKKPQEQSICMQAFLYERSSPGFKFMVCSSCKASMTVLYEEPILYISADMKAFKNFRSSSFFLTLWYDSLKGFPNFIPRERKRKIPELLAAGTVDSMTKLVLVNAVYFKGSWEDEFRKEDTANAPFRLNKEDQKTVKMMYQKKKLPFGYIQDLKCRVLELPYRGKELSMIILLPDDIEDGSTGLKKIEEQLTLEKLHEWTKAENLDWVEVNVHLPKFKLEESYDLNSHLAHLGIEDLFSRKADLSGMSGTRDLFISKVVHKSFVEVNEEGTEAAAATAGIATFAMLMHEENFVADHPFIFFIRHNPSSHILFLGRLSSP
uniref:Serpin family B member 1 n=1 Tax=Mustela putorius furo TaxID=9669 RepID=M3XMW8_MUSPF